MRIMRAAARRMLHILFGEYQFNRVYRLDGPVAPLALDAGRELIELGDEQISDLRSNPDPKVRKSAGYAGPGMTGFGVTSSGQLSSVAFFSDRSAFTADNVWPIRSGEAALVELITLPESRGQGLAPQLISHAAQEMFNAGYERLYTWLWWTNHASRRAFEKSGWRYTAFTIELRPFFCRRPIIWRYIREQPSQED